MTAKGRLPVLPAAWSERGVTLRPRRRGDLAFLRVLFRSTRWDEAMAAGLGPAAAIRFLDSQFDLQRRHFDTHFTRGGRRIVVVAQGALVGRLDLWIAGPDPGEMLRLVDISLWPDWRGQGLGTDLVRAVQALAAAEGRDLGLTVDKRIRAQRLYRRLGFHPVADNGPSLEMVWQASSSAPGDPTRPPS